MPAFWATNAPAFPIDSAVALGLIVALGSTVLWFLIRAISENDKAHDRLGSEIRRVADEVKKEVREIRDDVKREVREVRDEVKEIRNIVGRVESDLARIEGAAVGLDPPRPDKAGFRRGAIN